MAKAASDINKRRAIRALEAKRDALMESQNKAKAQLVLVRAELKHKKSK